MEGQVTSQTKNIRSSRLMQLEQRMSQEYRSAFAGEKEEILYEEAKTLNGEDYQIGNTARYIKAGKKTQGDLRNHILTETLTEHFLDDMMLVRDAKG